MAQSPNTAKFRHLRTENVALPYITNTSPVGEPPCYISGSQDVLTSIDNTAIQRPAFTVYPTTVSRIATYVIKRFFFWNNNTTSYIFASGVDTGGGNSRVYKIKVGTDSDWQVLVTDATTTEPYDYTVSHGYVFMGNGATNQRYDGTTLSTWGITAPTTITSVTNAGAGNVPNAIGHSYCFAYGDSVVGYVSDISALSSITPSFGSACTNTIVGPHSTVARCDKVHVYRTEDGGATLLELSNSPIANPAGNWTITDNDTDASLQVASPAPLRYVNAVPPALLQPTIFAGRIWGFLPNSDQVVFSTLEENNTSVPEECFGTTRTNGYRFGRNVKGLGVTGGNPSYLVVYTERGIWQISGDSLVTFARNSISKTHGLHYRHNIAEYKDNLIHFDISNTLVACDGLAIGEPDLSLPIRPDLASISHSTSQVAVHRDGKRTWIMLMDGTTGAESGLSATLYIFDTDRKMWLPPWKTLTGLTCIASNAVFTSGVKLYLARYGRSVAMDDTLTQDDDPTLGSGTKVGYTSELRMSLQNINKENPTGMSDVEYVAVERNNQALSDVQILMDDDPANATYTSIVNNDSDPDQRVPGTYLAEKWYWNRTAVSPGQRTSVKFRWVSSDTFTQPWKFYAFDIVHNVVK